MDPELSWSCFCLWIAVSLLIFVGALEAEVYYFAILVMSPLKYFKIKIHRPIIYSVFLALSPLYN